MNHQHLYGSKLGFSNKNKNKAEAPINFFEEIKKLLLSLLQMQNCDQRRFYIFLNVLFYMHPEMACSICIKIH